MYYTTGKVPPGNWNTFMGDFVVKPPPPPAQTYTLTDLLVNVANQIKASVKAETKGSKSIAEGAILSDKFLSTGYTIGEYLDYGESLSLLVFSVKDAPVELYDSKGKCLPTLVAGKDAAIKVQMFN